MYHLYTGLCRSSHEGIDFDFSNNVSPGDVILGGNNFGWGSSREQVLLALKHAGMGCVAVSQFRIVCHLQLSGGHIPVSG
jgi:3-isopropylmalate dehydratase small subunit